MEVIRQKIKCTLPLLSNELLESTMKILIEIGVTTEEDLKFVREADLSAILLPIQVRKLIQSWKQLDSFDFHYNSGGTTEPDCAKTSLLRQSSPKKSIAVPSAEGVITPITPPHLSALSASEESTTDSNSNSLSLASLLSSDWVDEFEIPWGKMPPHITKALKEGQKLNPVDRREFINIVSRSIFKICQKPGKAKLKQIAKKAVRTYPKALSDMWCGEVLAGGCESLTKSFTVKFDNLNRQSTFSGFKRQLKASVGSDDPAPRKIMASHQYGCINWQPAMLPDGETDESQLEKKEEMKRLSSIVEPNNISEDCMKLLKDTYFSQRTDINSLMNVKTLMQSWPLLFQIEGFLQHFKCLVGIDIAKTMENSMKVKGKKIVAFFEQSLNQNRKIRETLQIFKDCEVGSYELIVRLLMDYFKENQEDLIVGVDVSLTLNDVENLNILPDTPCIIICEDVEELCTSNYMVAVGKRIINDDLPNFNSAFLMMFASFYILNIEYSQNASSTLEFIQRCFLGINPDKGSKVSKKRKKTEVWDGKVLTLLNKLMHFEWC